MLLIMSLMVIGAYGLLFLACRALCATQDERDSLKAERDSLAQKLTAESHRAEDLAAVLRRILQEARQ